MTHIHYVECNTTHADQFVIDVPVGYHWLLVVTKTPAEFWVNDEFKEYPAFSAVLYRPGQKVLYRACSDPYINDWIRFETNEPYITESPLPFGVPFTLQDPDYSQKLFELLAFEHRYNNGYRESSIDCLMRTLINKLLESYRHDAITPRYYELLRLRNTIQNNPGDYWSVARMANTLGVSQGYFQSLYKQAFGISCMDDVIHSRIRLAKEYLIHTTQSVAEIAARCGYQNVEHFCRQFKQLTGSTPRKFSTSAEPPRPS